MNVGPLCQLLEEVVCRMGEIETPPRHEHRILETGDCPGTDLNSSECFFVMDSGFKAGVGGMDNSSMCKYKN